MKTETIVYDKDQARELWRAYRTHKHYSTPIDQEIAAVYQQLARGRTVIRAIASIVAAGTYIGGAYNGLPKLAIARADAKEVFWRPADGGGVFSVDAWRRENQAQSRRVEIARGQWPGMVGRFSNATALLPPIPIQHRPKRGLENYHVLWEAEWRPTPPGDPMLLRRIGKSDAWLVVAAWDLTEVERAVLVTRLNA